jgi:hypothetical protein
MRRLLTLALLAATLRAQDGAIAVHARDATTKAPVADVELRLRGASTDISLKTGADGSARFEHLPAGPFTLIWTRSGYSESQEGLQLRSVRLQPGAITEDVRLDLMASTAIEGTVVDEEGHPMRGVEVFARKHSYNATDAEGRYRIGPLVPGYYWFEYRVPIELRRQTLKRDESTGEAFGYPRTAYYPGGADPQAISMIQVTGGLDLHGYDVRMRRVRLVEFTGRVVERAGGDPVRGARLSLQIAPNSPVAGESFQEQPAGAAGGFHFDLIQPGSYLLLIYRKEGTKALPYILAAEVGKTGIQDREIVVPRSGPLEIAVRVKDGGEWAGQVLFCMASRTAGGGTTGGAITSDRFLLDDLPPGQWRFTFDSNAVLRPQFQRLAVTAASFGAVNALTDPITVTESGNPVLEVELSTESGRIAGTVTGAVAGRDLVLLRRAGAEGGSFLPASSSVKPDGTFLIDDLAPGQYEVGVLNPSSMHVPGLTRVEVKAGETAVVKLDVQQ